MEFEWETQNGLCIVAHSKCPDHFEARVHIFLKVLLGDEYYSPHDLMSLMNTGYVQYNDQHGVESAIRNNIVYSINNPDTIRVPTGYELDQIVEALVYVIGHFDLKTQKNVNSKER